MFKPEKKREKKERMNEQMKERKDELHRVTTTIWEWKLYKDAVECHQFLLVSFSNDRKWPNSKPQEMEGWQAPVLAGIMHQSKDVVYLKMVSLKPLHGC